MVGELGLRCCLELDVDASAAIGIIQHQGLGKARHIAVGDLWLQDKARDGRLKLHKIGTLDNTADLGTRALPRNTIYGHVSKLGGFSPEADDTIIV